MKTKTTRVSLLSLLSLSILSAGAAFGQILTVAEYTFTGGNVSSVTSNYSVTASNVTDTKSYIGASASNNNFFIGAADGTNPSFSTDVAGAISTDRRFSFTLTPDLGTPISIQTVSFNIGGNSGGGRSFTGNIQVRSSLDSFATNLGTATYDVPTSGGSTSLTPGSFSIDLSGNASFQNLTSAVTFNFYGFFTSYSATPPGNASDAIRVDNVIVTAIPEPSTWLMVGAGMGFLLLFRRRRVA